MAERLSGVFGEASASELVVEIAAVDASQLSHIAHRRHELNDPEASDDFLLGHGIRRIEWVAAAASASALSSSLD